MSEINLPRGDIDNHFTAYLRGRVISYSLQLLPVPRKTSITTMDYVCASFEIEAIKAIASVRIS